jgi:hypothetical protein
LFDLQVSPQYISEEDNETESENEILCTPKPKRLRKSNKRKSYEYYDIFQMRWKKFNIKIYPWITLHIITSTRKNIIEEII